MIQRPAARYHSPVGTLTNFVIIVLKGAKTIVIKNIFLAQTLKQKCESKNIFLESAKSNKAFYFC